MRVFLIMVSFAAASCGATNFEAKRNGDEKKSSTDVSTSSSTKTTDKESNGASEKTTGCAGKTNSSPGKTLVHDNKIPIKKWLCLDAAFDSNVVKAKALSMKVFPYYGKDKEEGGEVFGNIFTDEKDEGHGVQMRDAILNLDYVQLKDIERAGSGTTGRFLIILCDMQLHYTCTIGSRAVISKIDDVVVEAGKIISFTDSMAVLPE